MTDIPVVVRDCCDWIADNGAITTQTRCIFVEVLEIYISENVDDCVDIHEQWAAISARRSYVTNRHLQYSLAE